MADVYYLLIDAGNSLCKFALYNALNDQKFFYKICEYKEINQFFYNELKKINIGYIFISSVKNKKQIHNLVECCKRYWDCNAELFNPVNYKHIPSKYKNFSSLGADRWASIMALYLQGKKNFCIMDCGTAITVDYVIDNVHIGGLIGPGLNSLSRCLLQLTAQTELSEKNKHIDSINFYSDNTSDCILSASKLYFNSFTDAVLMENKKKYGADFITYLTGGDNLKVVNKNAYHIVYSPNLVIDGLFYLKKEMGKKCIK